MTRGLMCILFLSFSVFAVEEVKVQDYVIQVPAGFKSFQSVRDGQNSIHNFTNGKVNFAFFVYQGSGKSLSSFVQEEVIIKEVPYKSLTGMKWMTASVLHKNRSQSAYAMVNYYRGRTYLGYSRGTSWLDTKKALQDFMNAIYKVVPCQANRSLTSSDFDGRKFYLGFGDVLNGVTGNEVKYDIQHTHDIFTKELGGKYEGATLLEEKGADKLRARWLEMEKQMGPSDMYVQFSAGHGAPTGLAFGVSYDEIRDRVLSLPGKESIIFTMACHSGGLIESFKKKQSEWAKWKEQGKTLFVMTSSSIDETSCTGPGLDPEEPGGPQGSAGSAFGNALWKALSGKADGALDGIVDGYISLGEIRQFVTLKTQALGGHTPVVTGSYQDNLIMNRVPTESELSRLGLSLE